MDGADSAGLEPLSDDDSDNSAGGIANYWTPPKVALRRQRSQFTAAIVQSEHRVVYAACSFFIYSRRKPGLPYCC